LLALIHQGAGGFFDDFCTGVAFQCNEVFVFTCKVVLP
jgi:hypothetical protein